MSFSKGIVYRICDDNDATLNSFEVFETEEGIGVESYYVTKTIVGNIYVSKQAAKLVAEAMLDLCSKPDMQNSPSPCKLAARTDGFDAEKELSIMRPEILFSDICEIVDIARRLVNLGRNDLAIDTISKYTSLDFYPARDFVAWHIKMAD